MKKGGYKIIDFNDTPLVNGQKVQIKGIYKSIENNYRKALLLSGLVLDNIGKIDVFASYNVSNSMYVFDCYGYTITIDSGDNVLINKKGV